jgi:Cof subfamily protein (haloacid dehalogenase superfamily)
MKGLRLVAVDLDGTLLTSESKLAPQGARALAEAAEQGVRVILATTRTPDSVRAFAREIGLRDILICTNGAEIWLSPKGPVWVKRSLDAALARAVAGLADRQGWSLITTAGETTYYRQAPGQALGPVGPHRVVVARNTDALLGDAPTRILTYEPDGMRELAAFCERSYPDKVHLETYFYADGRPKSIGLFAPGADKGTALSLVMDHLGIGMEEVMVVGDNPNDLPMFSCAGIRVAMGNATYDVRQAATVVAPSNDEEGVAWAVERYILS